MEEPAAGADGELVAVGVDGAVEDDAGRKEVRGEIGGGGGEVASGVIIVYRHGPLIVGCATPGSSPEVMGMIEPVLSAGIMVRSTFGENGAAIAFIAMFG